VRSRELVDQGVLMSVSVYCLRLRSPILILALAGAAFASVLTTPALAAPAVRSCAVDLASGAVSCADTASGAAADVGGRNRVNGDYSVVTIYQNLNFGGDSLTFTLPHRCTATFSDTDGRVADLTQYRLFFGGPAWNDRISSVRTHDNSFCYVRFYEHIYGKGAASPFFEESSDLRPSGWNDRASSFRLT